MYRNNAINAYTPTTISTDFQPHQQQEAHPEPVEINRIWGVLHRRWWLMLLVLAVVITPGVLYIHNQQPVYTASALMVVPTGQSFSSAPDDLRLLNDLVSLAKGRSVPGTVQVLESLDMIVAVSQKISPEDLQKGFGEEAVESGLIPKWALKYSTRRDSDVITVTAQAYDPYVAANLANIVVDTYIERDRESSGQAVKLGREYVTKELDSIRQKLNSAQQELAQFKRKTKIIAAEDQLKQMAVSMAALQSEQDKANVELASMDRQVEELRNQLKAQGNEIQESQTIQISPEYQEALNNLAKLSAERANLLQEYTPNSKEVKNIDGEIAEVKQQMKKIAETVVASKVRTRNPVLDMYIGSVISRAASDAKSRAIKQVIASHDKRLEQLPDQERTYTDLQRKVSVLEGTFQALSSKYYSLLINEKSTLPNALLAAAAQPSSIPAFPRKVRDTTLFALIGIALAVLVASIAEQLDKKIRYENTITKVTGEAPLAIIPNQKSLGKQGTKICEMDSCSPFIESLRVLRNLINFNSSKPIRILAVTSPSNDEGKSTISVGLAVTMAMAGKKVLVVDCDLRRPILRRQLGESSSTGFTSLVNRSSDIKNAIQPTSIERLFCLPSGPLPKNPSEFLDSPECREMLKKLAKDYDLLILDCPPCVGLSDVQVISTIADGVLLVVAANKTELPDFYSALKTLGQVNAPFIGTVINKSNMDWGNYSYYKYHGSSDASDKCEDKQLRGKSNRERASTLLDSQQR